MRNFWRLAWLSYKGLYITWQGHAYIFRVFLTPILWVLIISLFGKFAAHPRLAEGYIVGMVVFALPFVIVDGIVGAFQHERTYGTLSILFVSPGKPIEDLSEPRGGSLGERDRCASCESCRCLGDSRT